MSEMSKKEPERLKGEWVIQDFKEEVYFIEESLRRNLKLKTNKRNCQGEWNTREFS